MHFTEINKLRQNGIPCTNSGPPSVLGMLMNYTFRSLDDHWLGMIVAAPDLSYVVRAISREDRGTLASPIHNAVPSLYAILSGFALLTV